ncbi:MAG: hypothetical protein CL663_03995 [Bacteroidetes bacterium]|nr:hypothetical protein [Bacteroidota bacterium]
MKKLDQYKFFKIFPLLSLVGLLLGILGGYLYYSEIGCVDGTCAITSNPWLSMLWGGLMGYLLFGMFTQKKESSPQKEE